MDASVRGLRSRTAVTITTSALALTLLGCGGDSTGPSAPGTFAVVVTGDVFDIARGTAHFTEDGRFVLTLINGSEPCDPQLRVEDIFRVFGEEARPQVGTHVVSESGPLEPGMFGAHWFKVRDQGGSTLYSSGGTLTISASSDSRIAGRFRFGARGSLDGRSDVEVAIEGSFDAVYVDDLPCPPPV